MSRITPARERPEPTDRARDTMAHLVTLSKRTTGLQLPTTFLRDYSTALPPLAQLIRGGQGGEVRTKLYLTCALAASGGDFSYARNTPARSWAAALNLEDPDKHGARRVSDAFRWLHDHRFLRVSIGRGRVPDFTVVTALKGTAYSKPNSDYVTVPLGLWSNHWISAFSAADIAVLLAILDAPGGNERYLTGAVKKRYHLSDDSWTRGTKKLTELGIITVERRVAGGPTTQNRIRNIYTLLDPNLSRTPAWPIPNPKRPIK
ncbi:hypothetical protein [Nocardia asiatica]|uniref:hypothetical protein n=1 Tax=Nocardia asiatica TaxID=209252 RepID=UPI003EDFD750